MPRSVNSVASRARRKKILKEVKGQFGRRKNVWTVAKNAYEKGQVYAYLNRCAHVAMEMDYQPNRFFDSTGQWLMCATHGATYAPQTGACTMGPCRGGLIKIDTSERDGVVHWHTANNLLPFEF